MSSIVEEEGQHEEEDSTNNQSLLDVVTEDYNSARQFRCSRVILVASFAPEALEEVKEFHNVFLEKNRRDDDIKDSITGGLYIINREVFVHVFESTPKIVQLMLCQLREKVEQEELLVSSRICTMMQEVVREFPFWKMREITSAREADADYGAAELVNTLFDSIKMLIELGRTLKGTQEKENTQAATRLFFSSRRDLLARIPNQDRIEFYLGQEELCSVEEFCELFHDAVEFELESELSWPIEPPLVY
eukprot:111499_1